MLKVPNVIAGVRYNEKEKRYEAHWCRNLNGDDLTRRVNEVALEQKFGDTPLVLALAPSDEFDMYLKFRQLLHDKGFYEACEELKSSQTPTGCPTPRASS